MNDIFNRMKALLENAGLKFEEKSQDYAELWAYSAGLERVLARLGEIEKSVFLLCNDKEGLKYWCDLLCIDEKRYDKEALLSEIKRRLSMKFAQGSFSDAEKFFETMTRGDYTIDEDGVVLSSLSLDDIKEAGKFINAYAPCFLPVTYIGDGEKITWDMWDSAKITCRSYDAFSLPWEFLDSLRSDIFE